MKLENEKCTDRIEIRLGPILKELLGDIADENEMNMSDFVRTLIIKEAKKYQKKLRRKKAPTYSGQ